MGSINDLMQLTSAEDEEARMYAMQLVMISGLPTTLKAAIELELLEIIVNGGPGGELSLADIAAQLPTENLQAADMVDRILRLLAAYRFVSCTIETNADGRLLRKCGAAPVCKHFTKNEDGVSMAALCLLCQDKVVMDLRYYLKDAVLEGGICFDKAHGMSTFEYNGTDPRFNRLFNEQHGESLHHPHEEATPSLLQLRRQQGARRHRRAPPLWSPPDTLTSRASTMTFPMSSPRSLLYQRRSKTISPIESLVSNIFIPKDFL
ncbi:unnamed protein product [Musa acuminata subsp. burmannicoides]|uniref:(wild Malaysian banana) hypothetical protein n=1 Tax=Musa acuminata subsp. malaccensis TaxID=214687 RepID=A0A8D6ZT18_MUSAM|nr:unnamed protein product [Musa acuminata subsp. malaccensis]